MYQSEPAVTASPAIEVACPVTKSASSMSARAYPAEQKSQYAVTATKYQKTGLDRAHEMLIGTEIRIGINKNPVVHQVENRPPNKESNTFVW
jgi:hypothetical protein